MLAGSPKAFKCNLRELLTSQYYFSSRSSNYFICFFSKFCDAEPGINCCLIHCGTCIYQSRGGIIIMVLDRRTKSDYSLSSTALPAQLQILYEYSFLLADISPYKEAFLSVFRWMAWDWFTASQNHCNAAADRESVQIGSLNYRISSCVGNVVTLDIQPAGWQNKWLPWWKGQCQTTNNAGLFA